MRLTRRLGLSALALGLTAPFAGSPYRAARGRLDLETTARAILDGSDHVSALELAGWIRERKAQLRVVDIRARAEFEEDAIPTAENIPVDQLTRARFAPTETIVLYSAEGAHAGQAWVMLRALGVTNAYFIAGGLADWRDEVIFPVLSAAASEVERRAFTVAAELSRYFGGSPRIAEPGEPVNTASEARRRASLRRRGC